MAKPAVTLRGTKGTPLTNDELDTNFENLRDATITLQADTSGTNVVAELNGTITLVAGSGITLAGDNSTKQITVTNSFGSGTLNSDSIQIGDTTTDDIVFSPPTGYATKDVQFQTDTFKLNIAGAVAFKGGENLSVTTNDGECTIFMDDSVTTGNISIIAGSSYDGTIYLGADTVSLRYNDGATQSESVLELGNYTTTERNALSPTAGTIIFNETTSKFQGYDGTTWNDLH
jgi:hypothetical protein